MNLQRKPGSTRKERWLIGICTAAALLPLLALALLLGKLAWEGVARIDWDFITHYPSRRAAQAGILPGLVGSLCLIGLTSAMAVPTGVAAAIYLEEYGRRTRTGRLIELNIANLAGIPSVIYGLLGLEIFVRTLGLGRSLLAGACTLALLVLPVIILSTREALKTVPSPLKEAALALGASRWQVVRHVCLPMAVPGILTGSILAVSRAIGETAPLIVIGALTYVSFLPDSVMAPFTALPIQIFNWTSRPQHAFQTNAAAGIVVLMATMLCLNAFAIALRHRMQKRAQD